VTSAPQTIVVDPLFNGPPTSGNGGYVCGLVAGFVGDRAEVTLRSPPPLGRPLTVRRTGTDVSVRDGEILVAEGQSAGLTLDVPRVGLAEAERASRSFRGFSWHPTPHCFVCGPMRDQGDGLRIFAGPVDNRGTVAAPWAPAARFAGPDGVVAPEFVWSALDCPGAFTFAWGRDRVPVVGRLAGELRAPVEAERPYVVVAWALGVDRGRHLSGTAVLDEGGAVVAVARATWFQVGLEWSEQGRGRDANDPTEG
jgi:hypothetical protein